MRSLTLVVAEFAKGKKIQFIFVVHLQEIIIIVIMKFYLNKMTGLLTEYCFILIVWACIMSQNNMIDLHISPNI